MQHTEPDATDTTQPHQSQVTSLEGAQSRWPLRQVRDGDVVVRGGTLPSRVTVLRMVIVNIGPGCELNVFELPDSGEADRQTPMFGRGRLDHIGFKAADLASFEDIRSRLVAAGATDGVVTEFGRKISIFFRDPDGLECEVLSANPDVDVDNLRFNVPSARYA